MSRQVQQNVISTAADGTAQAIFPGGVLIDANTSLANPITSKAVAWKKQSDGSIIAVVEGTYDTTFGNTAELDSIAVGGVGDEAVATIQAAHGTLAALTNDAAFVAVSHAAGTSELTLQADTRIKTLLKSTGESDYAQFGGGPVKIVFATGVILGATGARLSGSTGWTSSRAGVGIYDIANLQPVGVNGWQAVVTAINAGAVGFTNTVTGATNIRLQAFNTTTGALVDFSFNFLAWGILV